MKMPKNNSKISYIEYFANIRNRLILKESLDKKDLRLKIICQVLIDHLLSKESHFKQEGLLFKMLWINQKLHNNPKVEPKVFKQIVQLQ
jgi:hypothetical protein